MRLEDYLAIVRRNAAVLIGLIAIGCIVGLVVALVQTPKYRSTVTLLVSTQQASNLNDLTQGAIFAQQAVKNYAEVVPTPLVLQPALQKAGLAGSARSYADEVTVENPLNTTVLDISVTDPSPVTAAKLANAIQQSLVKVVNTITPPTADSIAPVQVVLVESAVASSSPVSPNAPLDLALGALIGLGLAVLVVLVRDALVRRRRESAPAHGGALLPPRRRRTRSAALPAVESEVRPAGSPG